MGILQTRWLQWVSIFPYSWEDLQGIFPTQDLNPGLPHCTWILYHLRHYGSTRILEWAAYPFSRGTSLPRNQTRVSYIAGRFFTSWATWEVPVSDTAAAAAKSLQLCPTLCDLIDGSPPGSPVPGILQARTLEWVAISFSKSWKWESTGMGCHCLLRIWHYLSANRKIERHAWYKFSFLPSLDDRVKTYVFK